MSSTITNRQSFEDAMEIARINLVDSLFFEARDANVEIDRVRLEVQRLNDPVYQEKYKKLSEFFASDSFVNVIQTGILWDIKKNRKFKISMNDLSIDTSDNELIIRILMNIKNFTWLYFEIKDYGWELYLRIDWGHLIYGQWDTRESAPTGYTYIQNDDIKYNYPGWSMVLVNNNILEAIKPLRQITFSCNPEKIISSK